MSYDAAHRHRWSRRRGTTLLETILYVALLAIVIGGVMTGAAAVFSSSDRNRTMAMLQQETAFILARCATMIADGSRVESPVTQGEHLSVSDTSGSRSQMCVAAGEVRFLARAGDCARDGAVLDNDDTTVDALLFVRRAEGSATLVECAVTLSARDTSGRAVSFAATTTRMLRSGL